MKTLSTTLLLFISLFTFAQHIDEPMSSKKMKKDLEVFKQTRIKANSGLYKYRTEAQIDSIYQWAETEIEQSSTYLDFYNIICQLTDFEGSLHNDTSLPDKYFDNLKAESSGYFPYPIKWIEGKWRINFEGGELPLGAELLEINGEPILDVIENLYKYSNTDGDNLTGKRIDLRAYFSEYYRLHYGQKKDFRVTFKRLNSNSEITKTLESVSNSEYYKNFRALYSKPLDQVYYTNLNEHQKYGFKQVDSFTGVLTIHSFSMGNENSDEHKTYAAFLDSIFTKVKKDKLKNLIVDVRQNGGGDDPNDLLTYSYLSQRNFQENKEAWISFRKIPLIRYYDIWIPKLIRPLVVGGHNRQLQEIFPLEKDGKYYQDETSKDHQVRQPNENAFTGQIYLLTSPAVASAGSLFAAMVAGNENTITLGEETIGGYYGHNGHTPFDYVLPKSKLATSFSIVNLEQDVPEKSNQIYGRGIIPDHKVSQSLEDFLTNEDTQMKFTLELLEKR
ncbi:S41 family peptidase [Psychroflexus montanilacus]|uniref:S41 family peptidase n=1 Tax=Psychroflexus montanilacus TaxID=2873598 RepID=UPI001CCA8B9C|nr:S41 family peptidase [Psychroflexus montanilacus]MBZ9652827.1 peptidase [Psychroflexus montanilacus]